jgi:hypothetical protein
MNIIQVCIAFGIYLALYYCVCVMRGVLQGLVMAQNILFEYLVYWKRTLNSITHLLQLTLDYALLVKSLFLDTEALCLSHACACPKESFLHLFERKMNDDSWFLYSHFHEPKATATKKKTVNYVHWNCQCDKHSSGGKHVTMF